jgi:hypothetical protein
MAGRKPATVTRTKGGDSVIVVAPPSAPVARRSPRRSSGGGGKKKRTRRRGGISRVGGQAGSYKNRLIGTGIGGLAYGFIEKMFPNMPTIPLLGKSGTVALAAYFFGGSHPIVKDVGIAAAAIAGYSLGKDGAISGYGGLAAQT